MEKLNVAIADDNEKMVEILGRMIEEDKDLTLVGKAHNGEEICNIIKEREPDVVVLDIIMPKMDGLTVMENCQHDHMLKKTPAFIVVLGAQVQGDGPSLTLKKRLDKTLTFMQEHPDKTVIVSGGQGPDEAHTEASVMAQYLLAHGADASQILEEPQASNTRENLLFSVKLAEEAGFDTSRVLIVTSDFHMCRAKYIARTLGMEPYGLSSGTWPWILKLNYTLREVFAFCKAVYQAHR